MKLPDDESKWTSRFRYLEVAHFVSDLNSVIREKRQGQPLLLEQADVEGYRKKNGNTGVYTSVFQYDGTDLTKAARLGSLYFDLDSSGGTDALCDTRRLVDYLGGFITERGIRIYFTGQKGFHVECEAIALGIGPSHNLSGYFRFITTQLVEILSLTTVDFAVYDNRRMWRMPGSIHQLSGLYKRELTREQLDSCDIDTIRKLAEVPGELIVPDQEFEFKANEWYREWGYQKETQAISVQDRIARFEKHGTNLVFKHDPNAELQFTPDLLLSQCPAILRLWEEAETQHNLQHEARLFLCSLLTYNDEAEYYLHAILSLCDDYNPEKSQAHINDWKRRRELGIGGRPFTCERANAVGVGCGNCELAPREKLEQVGDSLLRTGQEARPSPYRFAYKRYYKNE